MAIYPAEPSILRWSRAAASVLPKGRSAIVRRVARLAGCTAPFVARVGDLRLLVDLSERVSRTLYLYGVFEPAIAALIQRLLAPGNTVVDAGANFGYFSMLASRAVGATGQVFAVEPDPRNIERLMANIASNDLQNVTHVAMGLFDRAGKATFHLASAGEDNLGTSSLMDNGKSRGHVEIDLTTLDEFAAAQKLSIIDLVKMDIEGAEVGAVAGAKDLLAAHRIRHFLVEVHVETVGAGKIQTLVDCFTAAGYHGYFVEEAHVAATVAGQLSPLTPLRWQHEPNPHLLFTVEPLAL